MCGDVLLSNKLRRTYCVKVAFHDTDSPDTPISLRMTRAISSQGSSEGIARVGVGVVECGLKRTTVKFRVLSVCLSAGNERLGVL